MTRLDELSARRRGLYLHRTTQHINTKTPMPPAGFEPAIPATKWPRPTPRTAWSLGSALHENINHIITLWAFRFSWQRVWRLQPSGIMYRVVLQKLTDVSEVITASIFRARLHGEISQETVIYVSGLYTFLITHPYSSKNNYHTPPVLGCIFVYKLYIYIYICVKVEIHSSWPIITVNDCPVCLFHCICSVYNTMRLDSLLLSVCRVPTNEQEARVDMLLVPCSSLITLSCFFFV